MQAEELWNSLLDADRGTWLKGIDAFRRELAARGVRFGERGLCNHLRPKFLTESLYRRLEKTSEAVMSGIMEAKDRLLQDERLMEIIGLRADELRFVDVDPGYEHIAPCVRLDSFLTPTGPRYVELNGECPAGCAYGWELAKAFEEHPLMQRFTAKMPARPIDTLTPLLDTLLACYREWGGTRSPVIAIVDYLDLPTVPEFHLCRDFFASQGYEALVVDPRALTFDGESLVGEGKRIDLVYKRVLVNEFIERYDEVKPLFEAYAARKVCVVNPFRSKIVHKKSIFHVLTDDRREEWMQPQTQRLVDEAIPWTRRLREGKTTFEGREVDLLEFVVEEQEHFVLKPNDEYGGKGIFMGWECDAITWRERLEGALENDYVVQRRLEILAEGFPSMERNLEQDSLFVDLDPYLYLGRMHGALARLGAGSLCNVTSGGGQVPLFVVPD